MVVIQHLTLEVLASANEPEKEIHIERSKGKKQNRLHPGFATYQPCHPGQNT